MDEPGQYPCNDFEDGATLRHRAKNIIVRGFWLQRFMFVFVSNNGLEQSCDNESFPQSSVYKKKFKTILISSDIRLFKSNIEGQRKRVVALRTTCYSDRESNKKKDTNPKCYWSTGTWTYEETPLFIP
jgi:hypothetical protein